MYIHTYTCTHTHMVPLPTPLPCGGGLASARKSGRSNRSARGGMGRGRTPVLPKKTMKSNNKHIKTLPGSRKDNDGFSALHFAAIEDEALAVSCLLDLGVYSI